MVTRDEHYDDDITFKEIVRHIFTKIVSFTGHFALPEPQEAITTTLAEALHFRTGFHYIMVREMEMQIPIPSLPGKTLTTQVQNCFVKKVQDNFKRSF